MGEKKTEKNKQNLSDLWDSFKSWNISVIQVSEEEWYNGEKHSLKEYWAKIFPSLTENSDPLIHEAQRRQAE